MLSVIVPCYNEARRIDAFFRLIDGNLELRWEWIFVDDGSTDGTGDLLHGFAAATDADVRVIALEQNRGKGYAVRTGMVEASRQLAGYVDADLAASPLQFKRFLGRPEIREGRELLLGIRLLTEKHQVERSLFRHVVGRCYQTFTSLSTGLAVYDTQCGFKLMSSDRAGEIFSELECDGFAFDVELILLAKWKHGMSIAEEPISWRERHHSKVRPWHAARMFLDVLRVHGRLARFRAAAAPAAAQRPSDEQ